MLMLFLEQAAGNHLIIAGDLVPEGTSLVTPDLDGVKMLEITPMFQWCTTNIFLHTSMGVERGYEFENFSNKALFSVSSGKKQVSRLLAPTLEKLLKKSTSGPPWKKRPDAHAHKHAKLHHFCKKLCCITPYRKIVQQHQCSKQAVAGCQTVHRIFCETNTKSCQMHCHITENTLQIILTKYCQNSATCFSLNDLLLQWTQY